MGKDRYRDKNTTSGKLWTMATTGLLFAASVQSAQASPEFKEFRSQNQGIDRHALRQMWRDQRGGRVSNPGSISINPVNDNANRAQSAARANRVNNLNNLNNLSRRSVQATSTGTVSLGRGVDLDLGSTESSIRVGADLLKSGPKDVESVEIEVGGDKKTVSTGSQLTAAEFIAVKQVLTTGRQTVVITADGKAVGGSVDLSAITAGSESLRATSLVVPESVTASGDFARHSDFRLVGDLKNYGTIELNSSSHRIKDGSISADDITNNLGAVISSKVGMTLNADGEFSNLGSIVAKGNLTINSNEGQIRNRGQIESTRGDVTFNGADSLKLTVDNTGGTIAAENSISIREVGNASSSDNDLVGGDWLSRSVDIHGGHGFNRMKVEQMTGVLNQTGFGSVIGVATDNLTIGVNCLEGDPLYYNSAGNVTIDGSNGPLVFGDDITIIAAGNVTGVSGVDLETTTQGKNITIIAGAQFTGGTDTTTNVNAFTGTAAQPAVISGLVNPSTGGGSINLGSNSSVTTAGANGTIGGDARFFAFGGTAQGSGRIDISGTEIDTDQFNGQAGNVTVVAPNGIIMGRVDAGSTASAGGTVGISAAQPFSAGPVSYDIFGAQTSATGLVASSTLGNGGVEFKQDVLAFTLIDVQSGAGITQAGAGASTLVTFDDFNGNVRLQAKAGDIGAPTVGPGASKSIQTFTSTLTIVANSGSNGNGGSAYVDDTFVPQSPNSFDIFIDLATAAKNLQISSPNNGIFFNGNITSGIQDQNGVPYKLDVQVGGTDLFGDRNTISQKAGTLVSGGTLTLGLNGGVVGAVGAPILTSVNALRTVSGPSTLVPGDSMDGGELVVSNNKGLTILDQVVDDLTVTSTGAGDIHIGKLDANNDISVQLGPNSVNGLKVVTNTANIFIDNNVAVPFTLNGPGIDLQAPSGGIFMPQPASGSGLHGVALSVDNNILALKSGSAGIGTSDNPIYFYTSPSGGGQLYGLDVTTLVGDIFLRNDNPDGGLSLGDFVPLIKNSTSNRNFTYTGAANGGSSFELGLDPLGAPTANAVLNGIGNFKMTNVDTFSVDTSGTGGSVTFNRIDLSSSSSSGLTLNGNVGSETLTFSATKTPVANSNETTINIEASNGDFVTNDNINFQSNSVPYAPLPPPLNDIYDSTGYTQLSVAVNNGANQFINNGTLTANGSTQVNVFSSSNTAGALVTPGQFHFVAENGTIAFSDQNLDIGGSSGFTINFTGGGNSQDLAILAAGNVFNSTGTGINTNGGNLTILAGVEFTPVTPPGGVQNGAIFEVTGVSNHTDSATGITFSGGEVNFFGATTNSLNPSGIGDLLTAKATNIITGGGSVTIAAFKGVLSTTDSTHVNGTGAVLVNNITTNGGAVTIYGSGSGDKTAPGGATLGIVQAGKIDTASSPTTAGNVTVGAVSTVLTPGTIPGNPAFLHLPAFLIKDGRVIAGSINQGTPVTDAGNLVLTGGVNSPGANLDLIASTTGNIRDAAGSSIKANNLNITIGTGFANLGFAPSGSALDVNNLAIIGTANSFSPTSGGVAVFDQTALTLQSTAGQFLDVYLGSKGAVTINGFNSDQLEVTSLAASGSTGITLGGPVIAHGIQLNTATDIFGVAQGAANAANIVINSDVTITTGGNVGKHNPGVGVVGVPPAPVADGHFVLAVDPGTGAAGGTITQTSGMIGGTTGVIDLFNNSSATLIGKDIGSINGSTSTGGASLTFTQNTGNLNIGTFGTSSNRYSNLSLNVTSGNAVSTGSVFATTASVTASGTISGSGLITSTGKTSLTAGGNISQTGLPDASFFTVNAGGLAVNTTGQVASVYDTNTGATQLDASSAANNLNIITLGNLVSSGNMSTPNMLFESRNGTVSFSGNLSNSGTILVGSSGSITNATFGGTVSTNFLGLDSFNGSVGAAGTPLELDPAVVKGTFNAFKGVVNVHTTSNNFSIQDSTSGGDLTIDTAFNLLVTTPGITQGNIFGLGNSQNIWAGSAIGADPNQIGSGASTGGIVSKTGAVNLITRGGLLQIQPFGQSGAVIQGNTGVNILNDLTNGAPPTPNLKVYTDAITVGANTFIATNAKGGAGNVAITLGTVGKKIPKKANKKLIKDNPFNVSATGGTVTLLGNVASNGQNTLTAQGANIDIVALGYPPDKKISKILQINFTTGTSTTADPPVAPGTPTYNYLLGGDRVSTSTAAAMPQGLSAQVSGAPQLSITPNVGSFVNDNTNNLLTTLNQTENTLDNLARASQQVLGGVASGAGDKDGLTVRYAPIGATIDGKLCSDRIALKAVGASPAVEQGSCVTVSDGSVLFAPSKDMTVVTPNGKVRLAANSVVVIVADENHLSVYDIDDQRKNSVVVDTGVHTLALTPGRHALVTNHKVSHFGEINPVESIMHRSVARQDIGNGKRVFTSEFLVPSAVSAIKPLSAMVSAPDTEAKKAVGRMVKTQAIMMQLRGDSSPYEFHTKPKRVAMNW